MPHLQENTYDSKLQPSMSTGSDLPITEAKKGFLEATEGLLNIKGMGMIAENSTSCGAPRTVSEDASFTPRSRPSKTNAITPSPYGVPPPSASQKGPIITIYGKRKIAPSPIRVQRRVSQISEDTDTTEEESDASSQMSQPTNLRYVSEYSTPSKVHTESKGSGNAESVDVSVKKRLIGQLEDGEESSFKRQKVDEVDASENSSKDGSEGGSTFRKKTVISPSNSDDGTPQVTRSGMFPPYGPGYAMPHHYPHRRHPGFGTPLPFAGAHPMMYNGYPPAPYYHMGHPAGVPMAPYYPPYPHQIPHMMHPQYRGAAHPHVPAGSPNRVMSKPGIASPRTSPTFNDPKIQSVDEWRRAALETGRPPSTNRCTPLKEPIPSKYWGNAERTKDVPLPDFHRLVNFPDFLAKSRAPESSQSLDGKRNCVMCGEMRLCSASTLSSRGRSTMKALQESDDYNSGHIIPRQNKGLCTACDVTVWVVADGGLEIKWCKGCKNFRPWAAFGDKGSATKCVRCRDRQREKYALQKGEYRQRKPKQSESSEDEEQDEKSHLAAAHGLKTLMNSV